MPTSSQPELACATPHAPVFELNEKLTVPAYLQKVYWWAYVHPNAVKVFEREWLVNLILFGNYEKLRQVVLDEMEHEVTGELTGRTLQVACAYGDLTPRLQQHLAADAKLDVIDVLQVQLENLKRKLPADPRVSLLQRDSSALGFADASYDQVLVFFLLHEQPEEVRRKTLSEALRVCKPGGKVVLVEYHGPENFHPVRHPLKALLKKLEPYADDLWKNEIVSYLPQDGGFTVASKQTYFGGLYQKVVLTRTPSHNQGE